MENGLFDIPDYDNIEDESFAALPPPHSPGQGGTESGDLFANAEEDGDVSKLVDVPAAKRKGVKRPQPKLDSQRLISDRGLPALRTLFDNVRFKGKGHEAEDLRLLMQKMENWAHRLFPKLQFEDFIERVEKLGNKKEVQTCLKRIRLDMPLTHDDFTGGGEEASAAPESNIFGDPDPDPFSSFNDLHAPVHSTPAAPAAPSAPPAPAAPPAASPTSPSLTEEQRRRMELNRQRALERRIARQQQQTDPSESQTTETPADQPPSVLNVSKNQDQDIESVDLDSKVQAQEVDPVDLDSKDQDMEPVDLVSKDQDQDMEPADLDSKVQAQEVDPVDLDSKDQDVEPVDLVSKDQVQEVDPVDLDSKDQAQEVDPVDLDSKDQDQDVEPGNLDSKDQDQDIRAVDLDPPGSTQVLSSTPHTDSDPPAGPPESQEEDPGPPRSSSQCEDGD